MSKDHSFDDDYIYCNSIQIKMLRKQLPTVPWWRRDTVCYTTYLNRKEQNRKNTGIQTKSLYKETMTKYRQKYDKKNDDRRNNSPKQRTAVENITFNLWWCEWDNVHYLHPRRNTLQGGVLPRLGPSLVVLAGDSVQFCSQDK